MNEQSLLGPWIRRFLLEHLVNERNLAPNTQRSYRDTFCLLIPFAAEQLQRKVDKIKVTEISAALVRQFPDLSEGGSTLWHQHAQPAPRSDSCSGCFRSQSQSGTSRLVQ